MLELPHVNFLFQANIHSIMGSEEQVLELMLLLDEGLMEANKLEEKLDEYDHKLQVSTPCQFCLWTKEDSFWESVLMQPW